MTDAELRQLVAALARSERRFLLWAAHRTTPPPPPEPAAPPRDWVVVLVDTFRGQTYLVHDYARLMQDFPALPPRVSLACALAGRRPRPPWRTG